MDSKNYLSLLPPLSDEVGKFFGEALCPEVTNLFLTSANISDFMKLKLNKRLEDFSVV